MSLKIADDHAVTIHYTLTNNKGEILDTSVDGEPLTYLHGAGNIIPGLEDGLVGKVKGDKANVVVQPQEGYGMRHLELIQDVPRAAFGAGAKLEVGMVFQAQGAGGEVRRVAITAINGDSITIDGNHPLAGEVLNFAVTVEDVRTATQEELDHGHVHGSDGHHHH